MREQIDAILGAQPEWLLQSVEVGIFVILAVAAAWIFHALVFRLLRRISHGSESETDNLVVDKLARPTRWALIALAIVLLARELPQLEQIWERVAGFVMPALIGWMVLAIVHALIQAMTMQADITVANNLEARRRRTRLAILNRIATFVIIFITVGLMLLSIPGVRDIGVTLVASAGLAGLAVGAAAQPALKSLIAGVQMALTEPVNIDDVVIMDGEWGWIEQIRTTYVVVKIWDERRLIVPTSKFLEESFQNWTKQTSQLLGSVMLYLDPAAKIGPIRDEFAKQVKAHKLWDGRVQVTQVVETDMDAKHVRLLMSAEDSPKLFDLRCDIREGITDWIAENMPEAILRRRFVAIPDSEAEPA